MDNAPLVPDSGLESTRPDTAQAEPIVQADVAVPPDGPYQVVARRYRPQGFAELIGQEHVAKALSNAITSGRIGHAYLFTGARGVGKTSTARIFAKALNCVHGPTVTPCNECEICLGINSGQDVDVIEIDGASNRSIEDVKSIRQNSSFRPSRCRFKIYIIDEVHMLTKEAFNALLKTLEEPPEHVKFIFCTTEPGNIPITILSRCQRYDFAGIDSGAISHRLEQIAEAEGAHPEPGVCDILARRANGSMRDAQSLLEQLLAFAPTEIHLNDVHAMLGTVDDQKLFDLLSAIETSNSAALFPVLDQAVADGTDLVVLVEQLIGLFRDLMVLSSGCPRSALVYTPQARGEELETYAASFGIERILASIQILDQTLQRMRFSTQGRILTEMALVRLVCLDRLSFVSGIIEQLRSGRLPDIPLNAESLSASATASLPSSSSTASSPAIPSSAVPKQTAPKQAVPTQTHSEKPVAVHASTAQTKMPQSSTAQAVTEMKSVSSTPSPVSPVVSSSVVKPSAGRASSFESGTTLPDGSGVKWIPLTSVTDAVAMDVWQRMLVGIQGQTFLVVQAKTAVRLHFERPNVFTVFFRPESESARQFCQSHHKDLLKFFATRFPEPVRLEFALETSSGSAQEASGPQPAKAAANPRAAMSEVQDNPMVQKVCDLFDAEVYEVH